MALAPKPAPAVSRDFELPKEASKTLLNQDTDLVASEIHLRAYMEAAWRAILAVSQDGRIVFMNGHTEEIFGYSRAELFGQDSAMLLPQRFHAAYASALHTYFAALSVRVLGKDIDLAGRRKNGEEFPIEIGPSYVQAQGRPAALSGSSLRSATGQPEGQGVIAIGFVSDITDRRRIRDELAHAAGLTKPRRLRSGSLRRQLLKKLLDHHLGCSVDQALADSGHRSAYLRLSFIGNFRPALHRAQLQQPVALHKSHAARTLHY
jgi:PAS domain S-box-containing protein